MKKSDVKKVAKIKSSWERRSHFIRLRKGSLSVRVHENFFLDDFEFGKERVRRIEQMSGLTMRQFAEAYGFTYAQVASWTARSKPTRPCPNSRLKLVFIEAELLKKH